MNLNLVQLKFVVTPSVVTLTLSAYIVQGAPIEIQLTVKKNQIVCCRQEGGITSGDAQMFKMWNNLPLFKMYVHIVSQTLHATFPGTRFQLLFLK